MKKSIVAGFLLAAMTSHGLTNLDPEDADFHQVGAHEPGGSDGLNSDRSAGYTVEIIFTPTAGDLSGTTVLWEYGGTSNGASLILVDGVLTTTAKHNSNDARAPESVNDHSLRPDGNSPGEMAAQSTAGTLSAGTEYNAMVAWDQNGTLRLGISGADVDGEDVFTITGQYDNWTGNNSISFGTIGASAGGLGGELPGNRVNDPFDVNDTPVNNFAGTMGDVYFWNDFAPPPETFEFSEEPRDRIVWVGTDASFSSEVLSGGDLEPEFQWEVSTDDGSSWSPITGAEEASYTIESADFELDRNRYRVVVTRDGETLTSRAAVLRVGDAVPEEPEEVVAHYRFEEGADGVAAGGADDFSGNAHHLGAAVGEPLFTSDVPDSRVPRSGENNALAVDFTGEDTAIEGTDGDSLSQVEFTDFTIEVWVYFDDVSGFQTIVGRDDRDNQNNHGQGFFRLHNRGGSDLFEAIIWQSATQGNGDQFFTSNYTFRPGTWTHLAVVGNSEQGSVSLYADGELVGFDDSGFSDLRVPVPATHWTIGRGQWQGAPNDFVDGRIDEVRFSAKALSPVEFLNFPAAVLNFYTHPEDALGDVGDEVTFTALAGGGGTDPLTYQWEFSDDGGETWSEIDGATSVPYTISSIGFADEGRYRVVASRGGETAASDAATLEVGEYPDPVVVKPLNPGPLAFAGGNFTYSVEATGVGNISYQWRRDGVEIPGETGPALELGQLTLADSGTGYSVVIEDDGATEDGLDPTTVTLPSVLTVVPPLKRAISLNFVGASATDGVGDVGSNRLGVIEPDEVAGAVPVANWNNSANRTQVAVRDTPLSLVDDEGDDSGASATWSAANTWGARILAGRVHEKDADQRIFHGYIEQRAQVGDEEDMATVTIEGIPYDTYDVYIYPLNVLGEPGAWIRQVTLQDASGERERFMRSMTGNPALEEIPFYLSQATTEEEAAEGPATSYIRFGGASGSTVVLRHFDAVGNNLGGIAGVSIVDTSADVPARPGIVQGPSDRFVMAGGNLELSVAAESFNDGGSLSYQWSKDGDVLSGEEGPTLALNDVASADTGRYQVVVTDNSDLGQSEITVGASVVVVDEDRPVLLSVDVNVGDHDPMSGHAMLRATGLEEFQMAEGPEDNPMNIGEGDTVWTGLPGFPGDNAYTKVRDSEGLVLDGVTFSVGGAVGAEDVPEDSGGIEEPVEEWAGPLLRDYVFVPHNGTMTFTVGGLTAFRGRELTLVVYALGPESTEWDFGERNDVSTVTLAEANNHLGLDPVATDQFEGRELRFNEQAFAAFEAVVATDGTVSWTIGPVPQEVGLNAFNGFQMLLTAEGEPSETSPIEDWRLTHFGTTSNEGAAANTADFNGNGFKNLLEYALGTDPTVPGEAHAAISFGRDGDFLTLTFDHIDDPSLAYIIEATDELNGEWNVVETYSFSAAGTAVYEDDVPVGEANRRFLRLSVTIAE